ncbi:MAG TPA: acyl-ACP--UDP-N-acetylglucosamine O-acyltransferase [Accumulibacter sp.]|uniref:Acyl-[acyl-carrier-protein]--UDP-N-acetylglucosamine O-acyltransferase n=2 Tax=Candidatus Accumulibacter TaxID=327159 RepID=A0A080MD62_9PROT|nr:MULTISPECIES: acyl-ACP--UDP-N-acetylglucosamine O-acyltransferase [Candidatus Accumulibacter]KFB75124.1 MAG: Acyl-[acyl-carrier-protein]--UDP-N-acetylglucosamine O-acyltransferase [Candidatus Accumulibacter cognatus]MBN8519552.1 acyl-ACP--UDP-N-acetylglucosamine O-acyltransferase [Accumulibacter sp.]MBO3713014.1 acyl-ACP--UDP-N-acetylglucosamine O-acyltransferase [Accumulibacter sp.]MCC2866771.1 acyl-ACP--UDP-N-acetylglucosamine O-acyltransferase [Candidatus Accumulibacter phosphatis]MCM857
MIHPSAIIEAGAQLGANVSVGAFSIIGEHVEIGDNTVIGPHVVISGRTRIGCDNHIYQFSSLGGPPQDKKHAGEPTRLEIGDRNTIREFCTFNLGTALDAGVTRMGDDNWIMAYVHIAHDCQVGNRTVFANNAQLAGHVHIGDWVILGGFSGVHQFCRIGAHAMTAAGTVAVQDIPPFVMAAGNTASPFGINAEGLKRRGFSPEAMLALKRAYRTLYKSGLMLEEARAKLIEEVVAHPEIQPLIDFLAVSKRGIIR